jgi:hypothetical protein
VCTLHLPQPEELQISTFIQKYDDVFIEPQR